MPAFHQRAFVDCSGRSLRVAAEREIVGRMGHRRMNGKADCEALMNDLLPFAHRMLREHGAFHPFGGTISREGDITQVGAYTGEEYPPGTDLREVMRRSFRAGADALETTAIVCDVRITPPGEDAPRDAIQVELDHRDGYGAVVFFPYEISPSGELMIDAPFASASGGGLFWTQ